VSTYNILFNSPDRNKTKATIVSYNIKLMCNKKHKKTVQETGNHAAQRSENRLRKRGYFHEQK
jgi:hypothetical protein